MEHDVFVSYSHKDKAIANAICHHFENDKIKCWIAPRDIVGGENWARSIAAAIPKSKILLLIFSSHSNLSDQVLREVELAVKNKRIIVPVKIEDINPTGGMEYYLSTVHWIDVVNEKSEKYIQSLSETVKGYLDTGKGIAPENISPDEVRITKSRLPIWIAIASVVVVTAIMLFVFKDNIFDTAQTSMEASATVEIITDTPTEKPTTTPTKNPTPTPTLIPEPKATVDPNFTLDSIVTIPDLTLKKYILQTLEQQGNPVLDDITVRDMQLLEELTIISEGEEGEIGWWFKELGFSPIINDTRITSLEGLQYAQNLKNLILSDQGLTNINALSEINSLELIILNWNINIKDISPLRGSNNLRALYVVACDISDITPLALCSSLKSLDLSMNPIESFDSLSGLDSLEELSVHSTKIKSLSAIGELTNLKSLNIGNNSSVKLIDLQNLEKLNYLNCSYCNLVSLYGIKFLKNLNTIDIGGNIVFNLSELLEVENLRQVELNEDLANAQTSQEVINNLTKKRIKIIQYPNGN